MSMSIHLGTDEDFCSNFCVSNKDKMILSIQTTFPFVYLRVDRLPILSVSFTFQLMNYEMIEGKNSKTHSSLVFIIKIMDFMIKTIEKLS